MTVLALFAASGWACYLVALLGWHRSRRQTREALQAARRAQQVTEGALKLAGMRGEALDRERRRKMLRAVD